MLVQYVTAVDRLNEVVSESFDPYHPAILRTLKRIINDAHENNKWVGICGEMAADPLIIPVLIGLGIDELSMAPKIIPLIKSIIRKLNKKNCADNCNDLLRAKNSKEVEEILHSMELKLFEEYQTGRLWIC